MEELEKLKERGPQCRGWRKYMVNLKVFTIFILIQKLILFIFLVLEFGG
jgi:hypothetical protein